MQRSSIHLAAVLLCRPTPGQGGQGIFCPIRYDLTLLWLSDGIPSFSCFDVPAHLPMRIFLGTISSFLGTVGSFLGAKMLPGTTLVFEWAESGKSYSF
jgi:hypothetical protein